MKILPWNLTKKDKIAQISERNFWLLCNKRFFAESCIKLRFEISTQESHSHVLSACDSVGQNCSSFVSHAARCLQVIKAHLAQLVYMGSDSAIKSYLKRTRCLWRMTKKRNEQIAALPIAMRIQFGFHQRIGFVFWKVLTHRANCASQQRAKRWVQRETKKVLIKFTNTIKHFPAENPSLIDQEIGRPIFSSVSQSLTSSEGSGLSAVRLRRYFLSSLFKGGDVFILAIDFVSSRRRVTAGQLSAKWGHKEKQCVPRVRRKACWTFSDLPDPEVSWEYFWRSNECIGPRAES